MKRISICPQNIRKVKDKILKIKVEKDVNECGYQSYSSSLLTNIYFFLADDVMERK